MVLFTSKKHCRLSAAAFIVILAGASHAQPGPTAPAAASQASFPASSAAPATPAAKSDAGASAFDGYKPYSDEPPGNWKAANDNVARIGGWREYAKQAQQPDDTPAATNKAGENMPKAATVPITKAKP